jgi:glucose-6-phosphate isomerase
MSILKNSNKFKKGKFENIEIEFNLEENSTFNDNSLVKKFNEIYDGSLCNFTENKAASHFNYKKRTEEEFLKHHAELLNFAEDVRNSEANVYFFGIGGSNIAPKIFYDLYKDKGHNKFHFITGSDPEEFESIKVSDSDIAIIASKSFSTLETLDSYDKVCGKRVLKNTFAITSNISAATNFGIHKNNILKLNNDTGGRFSAWSPVNIVLPILIGKESFNSFLDGGLKMDKICLDNENNPALLLSISDALIRKSSNCIVVLNYDFKLRNFFEFAQQIEMESNGKSFNINNELVKNNTYLLFGGYGPKCQHSFFQSLFQGSEYINTYFIAEKTDNLNYKQMKAQVHSLRNPEIEISNNVENPHLSTRKQPVTVVELDDLTPYSIGQLFALWENKSIFNSLQYSTNAFDQFGVELGKKNTKKFL